MKAPWETGFEDPLWQHARLDAMTAMMIASGISGAGSLLQGIQQRSAANYNAGVANNQAAAVEAATATRAQQQEQQNKRMIGEAVANAGASGVDPSQGSPLYATSDLATQGELSRQLTLYQGASQAAALRQQAELAKKQGNSALIGGVIGAGSTLLTTGLIAKYMPPTVGAALPSPAAFGTATPDTMSGADFGTVGRSAFTIPRY